jgi:hypothetical protein
MYWLSILFDQIQLILMLLYLFLNPYLSPEEESFKGALLFCLGFRQSAE